MQYLNLNPEKGVLLAMGYTSESIGKHHKVALSLIDHLNEQDVNAVANFPTTLGPLTDDEFIRMERHGYEVAISTMTCYQSKLNPS